MGRYENPWGEVMWWTYSAPPAPDLNRVNKSVGRVRRRAITPQPSGSGGPAPVGTLWHALWIFKFQFMGELRDKGLVLI